MAKQRTVAEERAAFEAFKKREAAKKKEGWKQPKPIVKAPKQPAPKPENDGTFGLNTLKDILGGKKKKKR